MILRLPFIFVLCVLSSAARAQTYAGADDFSGSDGKWAYYLRVGGAETENGLLEFTGSVLQFTKSAGVGSYILGWDADPANSDEALGVGSYTSDWVMDVTATNNAVTQTGEHVLTGIEATSAPGSYTALMLGSVDGSRVVKLETNGHTGSILVPVASNSDVRLRLAWNATGRSLLGSYSVDGGATYTVVGSVPITRWPTLPTDGFYFHAVGTGSTASAIAGGQVTLDNFAIATVNIAGSDDFNGGTAKWATTYRAEEYGENGLLTFNGSRVEFTKSAGVGGHHYMWDGDGIAGNGNFTTPVSYTTSWVMEATARNSVIADTGKWASIGIEVATAPGSYTEMLLENYSGELLIVGETNSPDNIEDVPAPAGTDVRLRMIWDAKLRTLTGEYSFNNGASYTTLASVPISAWPVSPASTGFIFSITGSVTSNAAVGTGQMWLDNFSIATAPVVTAQPAHQAPVAGNPVTLSAGADGSATYVWQKNGVAVSGGANGTLNLASVQPADAGVYGAVATDGTVSSTTDLAIVGVMSTEKAVGTAEEIAADIKHANGNTFDQILLQGPAATIKADSDEGEITRMSYVDGNNDIVQVELAGPGNVTVVLEGASAAARPVNYNQEIDYVKGHASIVVTGANKDTNLTVFTVGRGTAGNPNLFRGDVAYDGFADISFIAISSTDGKFGGLRTANVSYWNTKGITGVYAPGVEFVGPMFVGDIEAMDDATPVLIIGAGANTRITGGDLEQANGRAVQIAGLSELQFTAGVTSHYVEGSDAGLLPAQPNRAVLEENGVVVTDVLAPTP